MSRYQRTPSKFPHTAFDPDRDPAMGTVDEPLPMGPTLARGTPRNIARERTPVVRPSESFTGRED